MTSVCRPGTPLAMPGTSARTTPTTIVIIKSRVSNRVLSCLLEMEAASYNYCRAPRATCDSRCSFWICDVLILIRCVL
ncbi:hypothetical protein M8J75_009788 [Diaphorina citri]|nr:hypothetical protein M8J75_009788 [Diaphorina citri]